MKFEKVSLRQFTKDWIDKFPVNDSDVPVGDVLDQIGDIYDDIKLPKRGTRGSAGYDFFSPIPITIEAGGSITIPTGIRCQIDPGYFLLLLPRSGQGSKFKLRLANTAGVIDEDYYGAKNEGHIFARICAEDDKTIQIEAGQAYMQAIFVPFGITEDDDTEDLRVGGFGSTDERRNQG